MNKEQHMVELFHAKYGVTIRLKPTIVGEKVAYLRKKLITEEVTEICDAINRQDLVAIADALVDTLYVVYGTAVSYGIDLEPIFEEVHRSNMTKSDEIREDGKVMKGEDWSPPDIIPILKQQGAVKP